MHDPMTVAHEIKYPWKHYYGPNKEHSYRASFITIWHNDPELDGSDDSCGWFSPNCSDADKALAKEMVEWEQQFPYFFNYPSRVNDFKYKYKSIQPGNALALVLAAFNTFAWRLDRQTLSPKLIRAAIGAATRPHDNFQAGLAAREPDEQYRTLLFLIRSYRRATRPWYKHPRWHIHHWSIQIHPLQQLKRWLFERCSHCGKGYSWGYCPTGTWSGDTTWHSECDPCRKPSVSHV